MIKEFWKREKAYLRYLRYPILYVIIVIIAKYTTFYDTGLVMKNVLNALMVVALMLYRFITFAIVPAILFMWLVNKCIIKIYGRE